MSSSFLEKDYAAAFPDLQDAKKENASFDLSAHFRDNGALEGRHLVDDLKGYIDTAFITPSGYVLLNGWLLDPYRHKADGSAPSYGLSIRTSFHEAQIPSERLVRFQRSDINETFKVHGNYAFGFVCFFKLDDGIPVSNKLHLTLEAAPGVPCLKLDCSPTICGDTQILSRYFSMFRHLLEGSLGHAACLQAYDAQGEDIISCWQRHAAHARRHQVREFGDGKRKAAFSFVTVLYGSTELLQLQYTLFFKQAAELGGQIIIASNSPEIHKKVLDISYYASKLYEMDITAVLLEDNAGFSEANNVAVQYARSENIALVNPDIFAFRLTDWKRFMAAVGELGSKEMVAPLLHYSDESVMHCGMSIFRDPIFYLGKDKPKRQYDYLLRVDHPYKGQLLDAFQFDVPRAETDAVTGGFVMFKRKFFESIDGLSTRYVFGHYEDADMCLRARAAGGNILCDSTLSFVHLEGKGSKGHDALAAGGSSLFNRCTFTRTHEELYAEEEKAA